MTAPPIVRMLLASVLTLTIAPIASAQLLPGLIDDALARRVEEAVEADVVRRVGRRVEDSVERSATAAAEAAGDALARTPGDNQIAAASDRLRALIDAAGGHLTGVPGEVVVEDGWRAVDQEWVAIVTAQQADSLEAAGVRLLGATRLQASDRLLVRVTVPDEANRVGGAQALLRSLGATAADRNHIYSLQQGRQAAEPEPEQTSRSRAGRTARIGLIDTALDREHPALRDAKINEADFVGGDKPRPLAHGTAVASVLVGQTPTRKGVLPSSELFAASVFYQAEGGATGATVASLVGALDWMAGQGVGVVNMSLAGPPNEVLRQMIDLASANGMVIVAAVGNEGPAARPLYPAGYPPVVGVTAVDKTRSVYRWANQGPQVDLAADGVEARVATETGGYSEVSGTSYAAPLVAAAIAHLVAAGRSPEAAAQVLIATAEDLGPEGRDDVFGHGLLKFVAD
jgi:minor extracellular protease Epr